MILTPEQVECLRNGMPLPKLEYNAHFEKALVAPVLNTTEKAEPLSDAELAIRKRELRQFKICLEKIRREKNFLN